MLGPLPRYELSWPRERERGDGGKRGEMRREEERERPWPEIEKGGKRRERGERKKEVMRAMCDGRRKGRERKCFSFLNRMCVLFYLPSSLPFPSSRGVLGRETVRSHDESPPHSGLCPPRKKRKLTSSLTAPNSPPPVCSPLSYFFPPWHLIGPNIKFSCGLPSLTEGGKNEGRGWKIPQLLNSFIRVSRSGNHSLFVRTLLLSSGDMPLLTLYFFSSPFSPSSRYDIRASGQSETEPTERACNGNLEQQQKTTVACWSH